MRVLGAGLFVFVGLFLAVALLDGTGIAERLPGWALGGLTIPLMVGLVAAAAWLFNPKGSTLLRAKTPEQQIRELEDMDLLEAQAFRATRAFGIEESEDEGLHYFLELSDGRVLFLSGQYLYDYEPITDDEELNQPRAFPCTEFIVRRHKKEGYVAEIRCGGTVLEPEVVAPPFGKDVGRASAIPEDGEVISGRTYDQIMRDSPNARPQAGR